MIPNSESDLHLYQRSPIDPSVADTLSEISGRIEPGCTVLDVGCAVGELGRFLTGVKGCTVDGIESNPLSADIAMPHYRRMFILDLEAADLQKELGCTEYDWIVCADVLEHLRDPGKVVRQFAGLLQTGGRLIVSIPNIAYLGVFLELLRGDFSYREEGLLDRTHLRFFTKHSFLAFLRENGFAGEVVGRIVKDVQDSEFRAFMPDQLVPALWHEIQGWKESTTYQFIIEARPQTMKEKTVGSLIKDDRVPEGPGFSCQVFWRSMEEGFSEIRSQRKRLTIGMERQRVDFSLPNGIRALRFDPADRIGFLRVHEVRVFDEENCLWAWDGALKSLFTGTIHNIFPASLNDQASGVVLALLGEDPWIELPIPTEVFSGATRLEIELSWPMSSDYVAVTGEFEVLLGLNRHLKEELESRTEELRSRTEELRSSVQTTNSMLSSYSWKITKPLRLLCGIAKRILGKS